MIISKFNFKHTLLFRELQTDHIPLSSLISLNCPTGQADKFIDCVNRAAAMIRDLALAE